jgi:hypothetical protein
VSSAEGAASSGVFTGGYPQEPVVVARATEMQPARDYNARMPRSANPILNPSPDRRRRLPLDADRRDRKRAVPLRQRDLVALSLVRCPDKRTA